MSDQNSSGSEHRSGQALANPRRLRLDADGRPLPVTTPDADHSA